MKRNLELFKSLLKVFALVLIVCGLNITKSKAQKVKINDNQLIIENTGDNTQKFVLLNTKTWERNNVYIPPKQTGQLFLKNSRRSVKRHTLYMEYDIVCYESDMKMIARELEQLQRKRRMSIIGEALWKGLEQFFFKGKISATVGIINLLGNIINGKNVDDVSRDFSRMAMENEAINSIDGNFGKGLASASFALLKLAEEGNFPSIENKIKRNTKKLYNKESIKIDYAHDLNSYLRRELKIDVSVPISPSYKFENIKETTGDYLTHLTPYNMRFTFSWNKQDIGTFVSVAYGQSPVFYKTGDTHPSSDLFLDNTSLSFNTVDIGVGLNCPLFRSKTFWFFEFGARNFLKNTYSFNNAEFETMKDLQKNTDFEYYKTKLYCNAGLFVSLKYFYIFGYYSYSGNKTDILTGQVQAGISIPLTRRYKYY
jgi:hypothetical protein